MPMGMAWSIPAVILLGGALEHLSFAEALGAFYGAAALITVLGATGWVSRIADLVPLPVVMAMVAGVFLPFVVKIVTAFPAGWGIAATTVGAFAAFSALAALGRRAPPILAALVAGALAVAAAGEVDLEGTPGLALVEPLLFVPAFSWQALGELVVPLAITVIGIHNMQGFAVLRSNGYDPPINVLTTACGLGSFAFALVGTVPACVTGPANAMLNAAGAPARRYAGGILFGFLMLLFGLLAPTTAGLALALPAAFIGLLGGLALLPVLGAAFHAAFGNGASTAAVVALVVSVADVPIANVGAPFWALVAGTAIHYLGRRPRRDDRDG